MIQSLQSQLEELEKTQVSPRSTEGHVFATSTLNRLQGPAPTSQVACSTSAPRANDNGDTYVFSASKNRNVEGSSTTNALVPDATNYKGRTVPAAVPQSVPKKQPQAEQSTSSGCIEPCSFEKLMKTMDVAIVMKGDRPLITPMLQSDPASSSSEGVAAFGLSIEKPCTCNHSLDETSWYLPLRRHADALVANYFSRHHRMFPILHQHTFLRQYEKLWSSNSGTKATQNNDCAGLCRQRSRGKLFPATVHLVFALASLSIPQSPEQDAPRADAFFRTAQKIDLLEMLEGEVGIEMVQVGLLMGFYLQSTEKLSKCWNISGLTIRMAQNMGLHLGIPEARKRSLLTSRPTQLECEMRTRVWYGCVLLDTYVHLVTPLRASYCWNPVMCFGYSLINDSYCALNRAQHADNFPQRDFNVIWSIINDTKRWDCGTITRGNRR